MSFFKMLWSFAPWISFLIIARDTMFQLKLGIVVAAVLSVVMAVTRLHRGVIMWAGFLFFGYAIVAVVILNDMWAVRHMGILANGALAAGVWGGILFKRPFTLEYAREHTDPSLWEHPAFLRINYLLTAMWASVFSVSALLAWHRSTPSPMPGWVYEVISYSLLLSAMLMSTWYPQVLKRRREAMLAQQQEAQGQ